MTSEAEGKVLRRDRLHRWSASEALAHPWLQRLKPRTEAAGVPSSIVQRIQRFGSFNEFKRAALETIAERCLKQSMGLQAHEPSVQRDSMQDPAASADAGAHGAKEQAPAAAPTASAAQGLTDAGAAAPAGGGTAAAAEAGGKVVQGFVGEGASLRKAQGLLERMMVTDGTVRPRLHLEPVLCAKRCSTSGIACDRACIWL